MWDYFLVPEFGADAGCVAGKMMCKVVGHAVCLRQFGCPRPDDASAPTGDTRKLSQALLHRGRVEFSDVIDASRGGRIGRRKDHGFGYVFCETMRPAPLGPVFLDA